MSDNEIIKALERCSIDYNCGDCPYYYKDEGCCPDMLMNDALDLINHQKAELKKIKTDLKYYIDTNEENGVVYIPKCIVDNLVKEMTEA